jgi:hypothetical protein
MFYVSPLPTPAVSGPSSVCGTGTYNETNITGTGNVFIWVQGIGYPAAIPGSTNTNSVTIPYASSFASVGVTVINQYGCHGNNSMSVTNYYIDPDFMVYTTPNGTGYFKAQTTRGRGLINSATDQFKIEETATSSPYAEVSGTGLTYTNWSSGSTNTVFFTTDFWGYVTSTGNNDVITAGNTALMSIPGALVNGDYYRITHTIIPPAGSGCTSSIYVSKVINQSGIVCSSCDVANPANKDPNTGTGPNAAYGNARSLSSVSEVTDEQFTFGVFPNPGNGLFTLEMANQSALETIRVYNMKGELVKEQAVNGYKTITLDLTSESEGIYMLKVEGNGRSYGRKISLMR